MFLLCLQGFVLGTQEKQAGDKVDVKRVDNNSIVQLNKDDLQKPNPPTFNKSEDMAALTHLNEASVLFNLRDRYAANLIYVHISFSLIHINHYHTSLFCVSLS